MNVEQRQRAADPQTKPPELCRESACGLLSSIQPPSPFCYYYSVRKLILIYRPTDGRGLSGLTKTPVQTAMPRPQYVFGTMSP